MKYSHFNILVPFDFTEESQLLLKNVIEIQKFAGFSIQLVHAVKLGKAEKLDSVLNEVFTNLKENYEETGAIKAKVIEGERAKVLLSCSQTDKIDLIFVSSLHLLETKTGEISRDGAHLLLNSRCPVVILNKKLIKNQIKSILLPLDLNLENKLKISGAIFFSEFFNKAIIRIASIVYDTDDFSMNKLMHRLQDNTGLFVGKGHDCVGEIIRCDSIEKGEMSKTLIDYIDNQSAEIVLIVTNDEEEIDSDKFHPLPEHMIKSYAGNMMCINPGFLAK